MTYTGQPFTPDIPGAQVVPAHVTNVIQSRTNVPKVLVIHTPEEPVDDYESTPSYFATANRSASTHYYQDSDGDLVQCVPERYGAIANGVKGKPYPVGTDPAVSLNYQSLSIEVEGYAAGMNRTCPPGSRQWDALRNWIISRGLTHRITIARSRVIGHYEVANDRSDPGTIRLDQLVDEAAEYAGRLLAATEAEQKALRLFAALEPLLRARDFVALHRALHYVGVGT